MRSDLADSLRLGLGTEILVYDHPAETVALPCVVIIPDSPYWEPSRVGQSQSTGLRVNFELQLLMPRGELDTVMDEIERFASKVIDALSATPVFRFVDFDQPENVTVEGQDAVMAPMAVTALLPIDQGGT